MTLRQLESFLAVARAGSFRGAASVLALSQPALSQQVKELESELGTPLFDRLGRSVALTEAGRLLQGYATRVFSTLDDARASIAELTGLTRGSLLIGASTTPGAYLLPALIARYRNRYPGINVALRIANSREIEARVGQGEMDLGIVGGHLSEANEICIQAKLRDELVLIVPPSHPFARRREIRPELLRKERLILREPGSATRHVTEQALKKARIAPAETIELEHTEAIKRAVIAGLGLSVVSVYAISAEEESGSLVSVRLKGLLLSRHFHVIRRESRQLSPASRAFVELLESEGERSIAPSRRRPQRGPAR